MIKIVSNKNSTIKEIKSLNNKKHRWSNKLYIIEGIKIVEEALENNIFLKYIVISEDFHAENREGILFSKISSYGNLIKVTNKIFEELSDTINSQGIMAVAELKTFELKDILSNKKSSLLFLDNVQDPGNMGTIIRTADAFNMDGIILSLGCVDPYNLKVVRSTMGSIFRLPLYFIKDSIETIQSLKSYDYQIFATALEESLAIFDTSYEDKIVLVIGNESKGVRTDIFSEVDKLVKIPMPGKAESLNAGVAASILMYEVMRQRTKKY